MFLQMPTKKVQELAKEEGEESEAKLKAVTTTSEGAIPAIAGKRRDTWRATFLKYRHRMVGQVHFRAASVGGNQFRSSRLLFLITTCAKRTGLGAAEAGL